MPALFVPLWALAYYALLLLTAYFTPLPYLHVGLVILLILVLAVADVIAIEYALRSVALAARVCLFIVICVSVCVLVGTTSLDQKEYKAYMRGGTTFVYTTVDHVFTMLGEYNLTTGTLRILNDAADTARTIPLSSSVSIVTEDFPITKNDRNALAKGRKIWERATRPTVRCSIPTEVWEGRLEIPAIVEITIDARRERGIGRGTGAMRYEWQEYSIVEQLAILRGHDPGIRSDCLRAGAWAWCLIFAVMDGVVLYRLQKR